MKTKILQKAFNGGEVSAHMYGRLDDSKTQAGASLVKNFIIRSQGSVENRTGFKYVNEAKYSNKKVRLLKFSFSSEQSCLIELGEKYFRFHIKGSTLLAEDVDWDNTKNYIFGDSVVLNGVYYVCLKSNTNTMLTNPTYWYRLENGIYEIPNEYLEDEIFDINYVQSVDILTLVHKNHPPMKLRRLGFTHWDFIKPTFKSRLDKPANVKVSKHIPSSAKVSSDTYQSIEYVVTAVSDDQVSESEKSAVASVSTNIYVTGAYNTISWNRVNNSKRYNIYKNVGGIFGFIGTTDTTSIKDDNIAPDLSKIARDYDTDFASNSDYYPSAITYYEQRKVFGNTKKELQSIWLTRSGTESDLSYSIPVSDSDRIKVKLASRDANEILHIVPLNDLIVFTGNAEWRLTSADNGNLTPTSISIKPQSYIGSAKVSPVIVNNAVIYVSERGQRFRELGYDWRAGGFITSDLSLRATHLFEGIKITDLTYTQSPESIIWGVSDDGKLIASTYLPEQEVLAFHQHNTQGKFESCCAIEEDQDDYLYVIVNRIIDSNQVKTIERQIKRAVKDQRDNFFVDSGLSYDGRITNGVSVKIIPGFDSSILNIIADNNIFEINGNEEDELILYFNDTTYRFHIHHSETSTKTIVINDINIDPTHFNNYTENWEFCRKKLRGMGHLNNMEVSILADGSVQPNQKVVNGEIELIHSASVVHIGLQYFSDLKSLPVFLEDTSLSARGRARVKNVNHAFIRVYKSKGLLCGADENKLVEIKQRTDEHYGDATRLSSAEERLMLVPNWNDNGQILIRQKDPLPLTIIDLTLEVSFGD